jgi:hypothetical protein
MIGDVPLAQLTPSGPKCLWRKAMNNSPVYARGWLSEE